MSLARRSHAFGSAARLASSPRPPRLRLLTRTLAASITALGIGVPILAGSGHAGASSITTLQSEASAIALKVETLNTKIQILSEEYDQAKARAASLKAQVGVDQRAYTTAGKQVKGDASTLQRQAIYAYISAGAASGLFTALSSNPNSLPLKQAYLLAATGSLTTAITSLHDDQHRLDVRQATLTLAETQAAAAANTIAASRASALGLESQLSSTLAGVKGRLADDVAAEEAAEQAAAQQAAAAQAAQAQAASAADGGVGAGQSVTPSPGSGAGAAAVQAAETQIGVPYVWADADPGGGFDCSGLTMWAWGRAGVDLPHSAQEQYDSIEHVSLDDLEPGDLIFYASGGYIYHVIMYIGNGQAIQAEDTGTDIQVTPVWPGAYGAGRP